MTESSLPTPLLRFGVFEMDLRTGELRKSGILIRLGPQPFKVLSLLVGRPGELVTREEIQREIWGEDTFVDYEQGLRVAIKKIRAALGDTSRSPRYIETLSRRGYRFIAPVERSHRTPPMPLLPNTPCSREPSCPRQPHSQALRRRGCGTGYYSPAAWERRSPCY
jgi:cholera toxin transcriptional activator